MTVNRWKGAPIKDIKVHLSKIYICVRIFCHIDKMIGCQVKKLAFFFNPFTYLIIKKIEILTCNARNRLNFGDVLIFCNICLATTLRRHCCCKHSFRAHKYQVKLTPNITRSKWLFSWLLLFSEMTKSKETIRNFMRSITSFIGCVCVRAFTDESIMRETRMNDCYFRQNTEKKKQ